MLEAYTWPLLGNDQDAEARKQSETALAVGIRDSAIFAEAGEIALTKAERPGCDTELLTRSGLAARSRISSRIRRCAVRPDRGHRAERAMLEEAQRKRENALAPEKLGNSCPVADLALSSSPPPGDCVEGPGHQSSVGTGCPMLRFSSSVTIPGQRVGYWAKRFLGRMAISKLEQRPPASSTSGLMPRDFESSSFPGSSERKFRDYTPNGTDLLPRRNHHRYC
jgi:hypothetical protein